MSAQDLLRDQMIPGSLFDQLQEKDLDAAEARDAEVQVAQVSDISTDGGTNNNGIEIKGADITIDTSTSPATFTGSGEVGCWPPIEVLSGVYAVRFTLNAGVVTTYTNASDGKVYVGAGAVTLDQNGITFTPGSSLNNLIKYTYDITSNLEAKIWVTGNITGTGINRSSSFLIEAYPYIDLSGTGTGNFEVDVYDHFGSWNTWGLRSDTVPYFYYGDKYGNAGSFHYGNYAGYKVLAASTSPTAFYTRTIKGGSMGAYGSFVVDAEYVVRNTGATSIIATITVTFGGTTILTYNTVATTTTTPRVINEKLHIVVSNAGATNAQIIQNNVDHASGPSTIGSGIGVATTDSLTTQVATVDTTADANFVITITLNTATNSKVEQYGVRMLGPYYAAS